MDRKRIKAIMLIAIAGAMLTFEVAGVWGALSVSRRVLDRADHRRVRAISVRGVAPAANVSDCRMCRMVREVPAGVVTVLGGVIL